jgi:PAS domain S-box-containing protein
VAIPFLSTLIFSATSVVMALAMLFLVLWQAAHRRENRLMALYLATIVVWGVSGFMVRILILSGHDPTVFFPGVLTGIAWNSLMLFALVTHYGGLWRYRGVVLAFLVGLIHFTVVIPLFFPSELPNRFGLTGEGIYFYRVDLFGALNFSLSVAFYLASLIILWGYRREKAGGLLPGAVAVTLGVLASPVPTLNEYSLPLVGAALSSILFARLILRHNLFNPLAELNRQLAENERRLRTVITSAPVVLYALDRSGVFTLAEGRGLDALGVTSSDIVGQSVFDDSRNLPQISSAFRAALAGESVMTMLELGSVTLEARYSPIRDERGEVVGVIGVSTDITERKQAEAALSSYIMQLELLERADVELTHELNIEYVVSIALDQALRLSHADDGMIALADGEQINIVRVIGQYPDSIVGTHIELDKGISGRAIRLKQPEMVLDVSADPHYTALISGTRAAMVVPLISQDRLVGVINLETGLQEHFTEERFEFIKLLAGRVAAAIDNARLYQTSQEQLVELRILYEKVSALEQMKTDMIRIAAHDLRTPIGVILGYLQVVRDELNATLSDQNKSFLDSIEHAAVRIETITSDILSLQRVEQTAQGNHTDTVGLHDMVKESYRDYEVQARQKNQNFQLEMPPFPVMVKGDAAQLKEAIANLIGNAIKYTPNGGSVRVRLSQADSEALFEVEDTGYGVPEDQQARLFQPFFRAASEATENIDGTGLGLHLVKNIVERHHGQMKFQSVYGKGSTFGFKLPAAKRTDLFPAENEG